MPPATTVSWAGVSNAGDLLQEFLPQSPTYTTVSNTTVVNVALMLFPLLAKKLTGVEMLEGEIFHLPSYDHVSTVCFTRYSIQIYLS